MLAPESAFPSNRTSAQTRLEGFLPLAERYAALRNHVGTTHQHVSRLSPALRHRLILEEEVVAAVMARYRVEAVEKFVQEVVWRTYWKGWLELRPQVWREYRQELRRLRTEAPAAVWRRAEEVMAGRSGVAIMDHFARELVTTGYLHNHARMWWAAFWIHVERLPWAIGADFFFRHLLDADPASNTLGWRWVAGLQTPGKTYLVRRSNLEKYCAPELLRDTTGLHRLDDARVTPAPTSIETLPPPQALESLPTALPKLAGRVGLWIHADDAAPEIGALGALQPASVAAFTSAPSYAHYGLSEAREEHVRQVLHDATQRARTHFGCAAECHETTSTAESLAAWARTERLDHVVAYAPHIGPVNDAVGAIRTHLLTAGVPLQLVRRQWDDRLFPHARSGYFGFWEKARKQLAQWATDPHQPTLLAEPCAA